MASLCALASILLAGCDSGDPDPVGPNGDNGGGDPPVFSLSVVPAPGSGLDLSAVGWEGGIPGVEIEFLRVRHRETIVRRHAETDASGSVEFEALPAGIEWIAAQRRLSEAESALLPGGAEVPFLAGGTMTEVGGDQTVELELHPARTGSMVISEIGLASPPQAETGGSVFFNGRYMELYNNAAQTLYLDGMLLGVHYPFPMDLSSNQHHSCAQTQAMRADPDGLWSARMWRFPGSGTDHPVQPGEAVVIAMSAWDHRDVHPWLSDLSDARFEFRPTGETDNPAAADMIDVGPHSFHRYDFNAARSWFLADPVDLEALPRMADPGAPGGSSADEYVRIPRERIQDAFLIWEDGAEAGEFLDGNPICMPPVNSLFDAVPGGFNPPGRADITVQRRAVHALDGRVVLLQTRVGAVDFVVAPASPGELPTVEAW